MTSAPFSFADINGSDRPLMSATKSDMAYSLIRQRIMDGRLSPGAVIDQEVLAADLGLSTTPVREALGRLESERLVIRRAHRDSIVSPMPLSMLEEIYVVRLSLDPLASSLAAKHASAPQRAVMLERLNEALPQSAAEQVYKNRALHRSIYVASGNRFLTEQLDSMWDLCDRFRMVSLRDRVAVQLEQADHQAIVDAVVSGNSRVAAKLTHAHLSTAIQNVRASAKAAAEAAGA